MTDSLGLYPVLSVLSEIENVKGRKIAKTSKWHFGRLFPACQVSAMVFPSFSVYTHSKRPIHSSFHLK